MTDATSAFDLVLHSELDIAAPAEAVWAALLDLRAWKPSVAEVQHVSGAPGSVGETLRVLQRSGDRVVPVLHRTVAIEVPHRIVQWMETEGSRSTRGHLSYRLAPCDPSRPAAGTRLIGELLAVAEIPATALQGRPAAEAWRIIETATQEKFQADHLLLKDLVERNPR